jgi:NitT/TauT family transport system permease protein
MERTTELVQTPVLTLSQRLRTLTRTFSEVVLPPVLFLLALTIAWEVIVDVRHISKIILPRPSAIFLRLYQEPAYFFIDNGLITLYEAVAGFVIGAVVAIILAAIMARSRLIERTLFPLAIVVKATPIVVIAPLLVIWMGYSPGPKVVMASLICFFPILVNTIIGLRSVNPTALEFFQSVAASETEIFLRLRVPHSLPYVLSSFKTAASLSVIGAVVAEWAGAGQGLGRVVFLKAANLDQVAVFAGVFVLSGMGVLLTVIVGWFEKRLLYWHESVLTN